MQTKSSDISSRYPSRSRAWNRRASYSFALLDIQPPPCLGLLVRPLTAVDFSDPGIQYVIWRSGVYELPEELRKAARGEHVV